MSQKFISFLCILLFGFSLAQWNPTANTAKLHYEIKIKKFYTLDIPQLKAKLRNVSETGKSAKPVEILVPTLEGSVERFAVYSAPVVVPSLAQKYDLGSYVGVGIDDPEKYIRFSLSGNDFQSMVIKNGTYQFVEPQDADKTVYGIFPKSDKNAAGSAFVCSTNESEASRRQIEQLFKNNKIAQLNAATFSKSSDKKFRTLRLAISTTGEYTQYFGGVPQALTAINATLTRVNGIFERDLALRLMLQDFPQLIYSDPATDPYSIASNGVNGTLWSKELQNNLTSTIGNGAYDIGHLFGASGGGGNSGCLGCVCTDNTVKDNLDKGSGFTSPADGIPKGDTFDIDFVVHEMAHQLGAFHTFSHTLENFASNVEPGSGSTIMGYAGITTADVQKNSDPYFHGISISQVQENLISKTCDLETAIVNKPPVISSMPDYTIPRSTAFVLSANATDAENDPLTYTWEQVDNATSPIITTTGNNTTGALFRSLPPVTTPTRYFPKLSLVMAGVLTSKTEWESVSNVARVTNYRITVRDNNPDKMQQQTNFANQKITVGNDGPFRINIVAGENFYADISNVLSWDVVNTNAAPYNAANVKISYTVDNGINWTDLSAGTPNDGSENIIIPSSLLGQTNLQFRIEALGNVFYAVSPKVNVVLSSSCVATVPQNIKVSNISYTAATVYWDVIPAIDAYVFEYRKTGDANYTVITLQTNTVNLTNLESGKTYEFRVKSRCPSSESAYSANGTFTTLVQSNCSSFSTSGTNEYIQKVEIERFTTSSGASTYTDFSGLNQHTIYLNKNAKEYSIRVTPKWMGDKTPVSVSVWIDFNGDGVYATSEQILSASNTMDTEIIATFSVPADAVMDEKGVKMRVSLKVGSTVPTPCEQFPFGEVEDYKIVFSDTPLFYQDKVIAYPNPFVDFINTTNVTNGTPYKVYDRSGRLISSGTVMLNKIDLSMLLPATYVLAIEGQEGIKIIKEAN